MTLTGHRMFQYVGILSALLLIAVGYWYFNVRAGVKTNTSGSQPQGMNDLSAGLTAYFPLDENTGTSAADASTNAITSLTLTNGPTWTTGQIGSAIDFDGTDDYAATADPDIIDFGDTDDFTLTGWFNRDTATTDDVLIAKRLSLTAGSNGYIAYLDDATDQLIFEVSDGTDEYSLTSTTTFTATGWNHFAIVWDQDSATFSEIYINGAANNATDAGTIGNIGSLGTTVAFALGVNSATGDDYDGKLDEIRVYDRSLSPEEIANLYRLTTPTGVDTSLKGYWSFNGSETASSSSTITYDRSGARNTGTLTNGPTKTIGKLGQALSFDGSNDYVTVADTSTLDFGDTDDLTFTGWFYRDTSDSFDTLIAKRTGLAAAYTGYVAYITTTTDTLQVEFSDGTDEYVVESVSTFTTAGWHHFAVVWDQDSAANTEIYIDGVADGATDTGTIGNIGDLSNAQVIAIGSLSDNSYPFDGKIDETRIYKRALSASEIKSLYDLSAPDKTNTSLSQSQGTGRLDSGLTAYFALDENTGTSAADASTNAITSLTLTNSPTWTTGQIGSAIDFDGTDDYATTPDTDTLDFGDTDDFTLTGWFNRDTFTTDDTIIAKRNGIVAGDTGYLAYIDDATDKVVFEISDGTDEYSLTSTTTFTATGWHHFAIVWDQDNATTAEAYIDGAANNATDAGTIGNIGSLANAVASRLGAESDNGNPFDGKLDEIRVYDRSLSPEEIANLYRLTTPTGVDTSLKGYWSFNGSETASSSSIITYDRSGARNTGTLTNGPTKTIGKLGQALSFDGSNDYVTVPDASSLEFNYNVDFSISIWAKIPATQSDTTAIDNSIVEKWNNAGDAFPYTFRLYNQTYGVSGDRGKVLFKRFDLTNAPSVTSTAQLNDGVWHLLTATKSGSTLSLYVDGVLVGTATDTTTTTTTNAAPLTIGQRGSNNLRFQGSLDEFRIYNRALSASEIKALYSQGK